MPASSSTVFPRRAPLELVQEEPSCAPPVLVVCTCSLADPLEAPIPGSVSRAQFHGMLEGLPRDRRLAFYCCGCKDDLCSRVVAESFHRRGYPFAWVLRGGINPSRTVSAGAGEAGNTPSKGPARIPGVGRSSQL